MRYDKLVRDKIPDIIRSKGRDPATHIADEAEYWEKLKEKLIEEFDEFQRDENVEEMADLLEVIDAILEFKGFSRGDVERMKAKKAEERGGFRGRIILEEA